MISLKRVESEGCQPFVVDSSPTLIVALHITLCTESSCDIIVSRPWRGALIITTLIIRGVYYAFLLGSSLLITVKVSDSTVPFQREHQNLLDCLCRNDMNLRLL